MINLVWYYLQKYLYYKKKHDKRSDRRVSFNKIYFSKIKIYYDVIKYYITLYNCYLDHPVLHWKLLISKRQESSTCS